MATFVLVHGAWHGGWAWERVSSILKSRGHTVVAPDLPGHGNDRKPVPDMTFEAYVEKITRLIEGLPDKKVVLAGHSMSGAVISQVAERIPERIERLVYVCAFLLPDGGTVLGAMEEDADGKFLGRLDFNVAGNGALFDKDTLMEVFYNTTPEEPAEWAIPQLLDVQPVQPLTTPISVSEKRWGRTPRVYIKCLSDNILSPGAQQRMTEERPCKHVVEIDADHAPFLSAPEALADGLLKS